MEIPKFIHQTAKSANFPWLIQQCVESIRSTNPNWTYRFYSDEDWQEVVNAQSPFRTTDLERYPTGIQKADIFRCAALYEYGGFYADVDVLALRGVESLVDHAFEVGLISADTEVILTSDHPIHSRLFYGEQEILMNNFMIAKPKSRFMKIYLSEMRQAVEDSPMENKDPLATTGPVAMTRLVQKHGGAEALKIAVVPYFWINGIPDMLMDFEERDVYQSMIRDGSWRKILCPYFVHCWWHCYSHGETEGYYIQLVKDALAGRSKPEPQQRETV